MLEQQPDGVVVVDTRGRTIFANAAARGAFTLEPLLTLDGHPFAQRFGALLRSAVQGEGGAMTVPAPKADASLTLVFAPLRGMSSGRLYEAHVRDAAAIVFIVDPIRRRRVPAQRAREAYGLTRAEVRVAFAVSAGVPLAMAAQAFGVSLTTVKSHLRRVFTKTGTKGQVELTRLMTALDSMPLP